jgi:hypothetical protein
MGVVKGATLAIGGQNYSVLCGERPRLDLAMKKHGAETPGSIPNRAARVVRSRSILAIFQGCPNRAKRIGLVHRSRSLTGA